MPPDDVMARFTEDQMIHLVAYQNLYGPITPRRMDIVAARLGMDIAAPNMKKGRKPRLRDHLLVWWQPPRRRLSGHEMRAKLLGLKAHYDGKGGRPRDRAR